MSIQVVNAGQSIRVLGHQGEHVASFFGAHAEALAHVLVSVMQHGDECAAEQADKDWDDAQEGGS